MPGSDGHNRVSAVSSSTERGPCRGETGMGQQDEQSSKEHHAYGYFAVAIHSATSIVSNY